MSLQYYSQWNDLDETDVNDIEDEDIFEDEIDIEEIETKLSLYGLSDRDFF